MNYHEFLAKLPDYGSIPTDSERIWKVVEELNTCPFKGGDRLTVFKVLDSQSAIRMACYYRRPDGSEEWWNHKIWEVGP
ncbi:MAG: hypothetical protein JST89_13425 [Cyanobacteria bacterium SZAS-4]|nr:hypothetical protein [Cyanobacteria bacterium SZAS-4]